MAKDKDIAATDGADDGKVGDVKDERHSKRRKRHGSDDDESTSEDESHRTSSTSRKKRRRSSRSSSKRKDLKKSSSRRRGRGGSDEDSDSSESYDGSSSSYSDSEESSSAPEGESEDDLKRRKRKERRRREREEERERRRRKEKERKKRKEKEKKKKRRDEKKKKKKDTGKTGAVTNSWGMYGVIRETDMWNKRPEFTAWLAEVKQVNLETLSNWEEKQMFKEFMEDHNTATFPSKKYYDLDAYHRRKLTKEMEKGIKRAPAVERTVFNDEEQRRLELQIERERHKEAQVEALKISMQSGMAQAMKEQARLREEMLFQYKLGNFEAAAAIQRRLDPDVAM